MNNPYSRFDDQDIAICRSSRAARYATRNRRDNSAETMPLGRTPPGSRSNSPNPQNQLINVGNNGLQIPPNTGPSAPQANLDPVNNGTQIPPNTGSSGPQASQDAVNHVPQIPQGSGNSGPQSQQMQASNVGGNVMIPASLLQSLMDQIKQVSNQQQQMQSVIAQLQANLALNNPPHNVIASSAQFPIQTNPQLMQTNATSITGLNNAQNSNHVNLNPLVTQNSPANLINVNPQGIPNFQISSTPPPSNVSIVSQMSNNHSVGTNFSQANNSNQGSGSSQSTSSHPFFSGVPFLYSNPLPAPCYHGRPTDPGPKDFLRKLKQMRLTNKVEDKVFLEQWLPSLFDGPALDWYYDNQPFSDYSSFEMAFRSRFQRKSNDEVIRDKIHDRVQRHQETVYEYAEALQKLIRQLHNPMSEDEEVRITLRNIRDDIHPYLTTKSYSNVRDLLDDAFAVERSVNRRKNRPETNKTHNESQNRESSQNNRSSQNFSRSSNVSNSNRGSSSFGNASSNPSGNGSRFNTQPKSIEGQTNSQASQNNASSNSQRYNPNFTCHHCNTVGHTRPFCPQRRHLPTAGNAAAGGSSQPGAQPATNTQ